jgi:hypothetical protein
MASLLEAVRKAVSAALGATKKDVFGPKKPDKPKPKKQGSAWARTLRGSRLKALVRKAVRLFFKEKKPEFKKFTGAIGYTGYSEGKRLWSHGGYWGATKPVEKKVPPYPEGKMPVMTEIEGFIYEGDILPVYSSNVGSARYDHDNETLYVVFHGGRGEHRRYKYWPISEDEAHAFGIAFSKGGWVWDHLRIRGTKYGHKKNYVEME